MAFQATYDPTNDTVSIVCDASILRNALEAVPEQADPVGDATEFLPLEEETFEFRSALGGYRKFHGLDATVSDKRARDALYAKIVAIHHAGEATPGGLARRFGVPPESIRIAIKQFKEHAPDLPPSFGYRTDLVNPYLSLIHI